MDLWVRSQDRKHLIKADYIFIDCTDMIDKGFVTIYSNFCDFDLGTYKSEERALEILDEIRNAILGIIANEDVEKQGVKKYTGNALLSKYSNNIVYEMPKE